MELVAKLERIILGWMKQVPHLPNIATKWLGDNVWWIAAIGLVIGAIAALFGVIGAFGSAALIGTVSVYYAVPTFTTWMLVTSLVSLAFLVINVVLLAMAIKPLQAKQKKGWTLLFIAWIVSAVSVVVSAVLSFNVLSFITGILFGAIGLAIGGYFLFEIRGQFAHVEKSKGVKAASKAK